MRKMHLTIPTEVEVSFPAGFLEDWKTTFSLYNPLHFHYILKISASKALYAARHRQKR